MEHNKKTPDYCQGCDAVRGPGRGRGAGRSSCAALRAASFRIRSGRDRPPARAELRGAVS